MNSKLRTSTYQGQVVWVRFKWYLWFLEKQVAIFIQHCLCALQELAWHILKFVIHWTEKHKAGVTRQYRRGCRTSTLQLCRCSHRGTSIYLYDSLPEMKPCLGTDGMAAADEVCPQKSGKGSCSRDGELSLAVFAAVPASYKQIHISSWELLILK